MSKIRINELARELEVKPKVITDYLPEIGITDKKSHSSALEEDVANKVREHFHSAGEERVAEPQGAEKAPAVPPPAPPSPVKPAPAAERPVAGLVQAAGQGAAGAAPPAPAQVRKPGETRAETRPMTRSLDEIRVEARKAVAPPPPPRPPAPAAAHTAARPAEKAPATSSAGPALRRK